MDSKVFNCGRLYMWLWRALNKQRNACCKRKFVCVVMPEIHRKLRLAVNVDIPGCVLEEENAKLLVSLIAEWSYLSGLYFGSRFLALVKALVITSTTSPWNIGPCPGYIFLKS